MDKDTDKDMDKNMDKNLDKNRDKVKDTDIDLDMDLEFFCNISIWPYILYPHLDFLEHTWRKFLQRYLLLALLSSENYSYHRWICSPNNVLAELEISEGVIHGK
jgi:hypothetical protein